MRWTTNVLWTPYCATTHSRHPTALWRVKTEIFSRKCSLFFVKQLLSKRQKLTNFCKNYFRTNSTLLHSCSFGYIHAEWEIAFVNRGWKIYILYTTLMHFMNSWLIVFLFVKKWWLVLFVSSACRTAYGWQDTYCRRTLVKILYNPLCLRATFLVRFW